LRSFISVGNPTGRSFSTSRWRGRAAKFAAGAAGRYDFQLTWTPDETQFASLGGAPPPSDKPDAPPDLFTAMQEQLGLRMIATKAQVDVLVVERAEKPSGN
jgi:uncharacterized protein (TIGR03435 family)